MTLFIPIVIASSIITPTFHGIAGIGNCAHVDIIGADSWYNWKPVGADCPGFVPMVRDAAQVMLLQGGTLSLRPEVLLGFNEPDLCPYQACLTPQEATPLERWRLTTYTQTKHASPAPSHDGITWLPTMRQLYIDEYGGAPAWDYLAAHCYFWDDASLARCKSIVRQYITWSNAWGADGVLVTEFASFAFRYHPDDPFDYASAVRRARDFIGWMNEQDEILGYFWFSVYDWDVWGWHATTALFDGDELTPLGEMYKDEVENARG